MNSFKIQYIQKQCKFHYQTQSLSHAIYFRSKLYHETYNHLFTERFKTGSIFTS